MSRCCSRCTAAVAHARSLAHPSVRALPQRITACGSLLFTCELGNCRAAAVAGLHDDRSDGWRCRLNGECTVNLGEPALLPQALCQSAHPVCPCTHHVQ